MRDVLEALVRRYGRQISVDGQLCLSSNGDPTWAAAFEALGWADPYPVPAEWLTFRLPAEPAPEPHDGGILVAAVVVAPETAVLPDAEGHVA